MLKPFRQLCLGALIAAPFGLNAVEQPKYVVQRGEFDLTPNEFPSVEYVTNRESRDYPIYGIYTWFGEYKQLREQIKQVGWSTLRISGPMTYENLVMAFEDGHNFSYMCPAPEVDGKRARRDHFDSNEAYIQASLDALNAFMDDYGQGGKFYETHPEFSNRHIPYLQLRNEPNFWYMWKEGTEAQREELYAELAPKLMKIIRERSPKTKIINFTAGGAGAGDMRFVRAVLKKDASNITETDVFSTHPYVAPAPPEAAKVQSWGTYSIARSLRSLRSNFAEYGKKHIPIWYTEGGWRISQDEGGAYKVDPKTVIPVHFQAAYNVRFYAVGLRLGVDCITQMFITDTDGYPGGFFDRLKDMEWRPNAYATQTMITLMPHPKLRAVQKDGEESFYIWEFAKNIKEENSPSVIMAYRLLGTRTTDVFIDGSEARITDMLGNSSTMPITDGKINIELGPFPIYIEKVK